MCKCEEILVSITNYTINIEKIYEKMSKKFEMFNFKTSLLVYF